jgi:WbqC-like protein family
MQPTYLPWMGYFDLIDQVDLFVFLDSVQFAHRSWQQRNRIRTAGGLSWLTVPVFSKERGGQCVNEVAISNPSFWQKHLKTIKHAYARAPNSASLMARLEEWFMVGHPWTLLAELNIALILNLCDLLGIKRLTARSSELGGDGTRSDLLVALCQRVGANEYLSPIGSAGYLLPELPLFAAAGIRVLFHNYAHPVYAQLYQPFIPFASVIDLLFGEGDRAPALVREGRRPCLRADELGESDARLGAN